MSPQLLDAKAAYARALELDAERAKGGRPATKFTHKAVQANRGVALTPAPKRTKRTEVPTRYCVVCGGAIERHAAEPPSSYTIRMTDTKECRNVLATQQAAKKAGRVHKKRAMRKSA